MKKITLEKIGYSIEAIGLTLTGTAIAETSMFWSYFGIGTMAVGRALTQLGK